MNYGIIAVLLFHCRFYSKFPIYWKIKLILFNKFCYQNYSSQLIKLWKFAPNLVKWNINSIEMLLWNNWKDVAFHLFPDDICMNKKESKPHHIGKKINRLSAESCRYKGWQIDITMCPIAIKLNWINFYVREKRIKKGKDSLNKFYSP